MVLLTGGTGFLGSYIIELLLKKGYAVRAIRRSEKLPVHLSRTTGMKVEWMKGDVLDVKSLQKAMEGVEMVIHSAGIVSFAKQNRTEMYQVNTEGTANMVNVALKEKIKKFIHVSSISAIGLSAVGSYITEESKWEEGELVTHYALSKFKAEQEVWQGIRRGLNAVILNPSTILGFGNWNNSSCVIFKKVYRGFNWYTSGVNGFVDVEDVAKAVVLFMESEITEQRFIISSENWTFKKLIETIAEGFGSKRAGKQITPLLLEILWRLDAVKSFFTAKPPILTREIALTANSFTYFDNNKILKALPGFSFTPIEQSIIKVCRKYMEQIISSPSEM